MQNKVTQESCPACFYWECGFKALAHSVEQGQYWIFKTVIKMLFLWWTSCCVATVLTANHCVTYIRMQIPFFGYTKPKQINLAFVMHPDRLFLDQLVVVFVGSQKRIT